MSEQVTITIHSIAEDGLPHPDLPAGRVAFIFDGCIVSGWPLPDDYDEVEGQMWEADSDVGHYRPFSGVTHWVEFPEPIWDYERGAASVATADTTDGSGS